MVTSPTSNSNSLQLPEPVLEFASVSQNTERKRPVSPLVSDSEKKLKMTRLSVQSTDAYEMELPSYVYFFTEAIRCHLVLLEFYKKTNNQLIAGSHKFYKPNRPCLFRKHQW